MQEKYSFINMSQSLILADKTLDAHPTMRKDIISLYGAPEFIDVVAKKETEGLFENLVASGACLNELFKLHSSDNYTVEISGNIKELLNNGMAYFDKSNAVPGNLTPNIRINGKKGIASQVTIKEGCDVNAIQNSITNLAMLAVMQSIL